jgi:hypothetical protein
MYKKMIEDAQAKGLGSEKIMWQSVDEIDEMLCMMKKEHPEMYWKFVRKQHGLLYNNHYTEDFARWDVGQLTYTNAKGEKKTGEYWTALQIEDATKGMVFPNGVTTWDKYVAANAAYSDFCKKFDDKQILEIMHLFYFADEDWGNNSSTKVWDYFCCRIAKK